MKIKTFISALAVSMIASVANAEFRVGISGSMVMFDASGTETLKSSSNKTSSGDVGENVFIPTIWAEYGHEDSGWTVGVDYVDATTFAGSKSATRPDTDVDDSSDTSGTNTASAELDSHTTYYLSKAFGENQNFYVKAGWAQADILTTESLATGTTYGDATIDGVALGLGFQTRSNNNFIFRLEYLYTDYDDISLTGSADADSVSNKVDASLDSSTYKISIGKAF